MARTFNTRSACLLQHLDDQSFGIRERRRPIVKNRQSRENGNPTQEWRVIRQTELTLETLEGTTGRRIEKCAVTKHDFPLIETSKFPMQTSHDRPHLQSEWTGDPIMVRLRGGPALCIAQQQKLVTVDQNDNHLDVLTIPDRLFWNQSRKAELSPLDM